MKHKHNRSIQEFTPPLYTRSEKRLEDDLRKAALKVANAKNLNKALVKLHMIETALRAAQSRNDTSGAAA